jgi:hypothetical protein
MTNEIVRVKTSRRFSPKGSSKVSYKVSSKISSKVSSEVPSTVSFKVLPRTFDGSSCPQVGIPCAKPQGSLVTRVDKSVTPCWEYVFNGPIKAEYV